MAAGGRGDAEVEDLEGARPVSGGLGLDESDDPLPRLGHEERVPGGPDVEGHQRGDGLAERIPETEGGRLRHRVVGRELRRRLVAAAGLVVELLDAGQIAERGRTDVHAALPSDGSGAPSSRTSRTLSRKRRWSRRSPVISGWKVKLRC